MPIVTLTTDLGTSNFYLASIKAKLLQAGLNIDVIDVTHEISPHSIAEAAFVFSNVFSAFPKNTIHILGVDAGSVDNSRHLGIQYKNQYLLTADNGFFSLIADQQPDLVVELMIDSQTDVLTFPTKDVYVPAALHLARGGTLEVIGRRTTELRRMLNLAPTYDRDSIKGKIIYIDHYGNAISNIRIENFKALHGGRPFVIRLRHRGYEITEISKRYSDVIESERLALFNSAGYLEIAINRGNASSLMGLSQDDPIVIEFER
ncbi:MAG: SAM-dependent chlorinase/fluorinase [Salibacteraceae bacterium]